MQSEKQDMKSVLSRYWDLLNLCEDYLTDGVRKAHGALKTPRVKHEDHIAPIAAHDRQRGLAEIAESIQGCEKCDLCMQRNNTVPGEGVLDPLVMLIGEGPGGEEDRSGRPFVGRAGQYLDKWLDSIELARDKNVFITNIVKCRPPGNRDPLPDEKMQCVPFLEEQIGAIRPKTILALGRIAAQFLTGKTDGISRLRGNVYSYNGIPLAATYHPSAVLRNENLRRPVWEDLKLLRSLFPDE